MRMQKVAPTVVNQAQLGLIHGRNIIDNVLLASELVKGYGRKSLKPRCMIKIDL